MCDILCSVALETVAVSAEQLMAVASDFHVSPGCDSDQVGQSQKLMAYTESDADSRALLQKRRNKQVGIYNIQRHMGWLNDFCICDGLTQRR